MPQNATKKDLNNLGNQIDKKFNNFRNEIIKHNQVLYEKFQQDIRIIGEGWNGTRQKVDATFDLIGELKEDSEIIKSDIAFIKNTLKIKVDRDEFVALEKRVILLENKFKRA